MPQVWQPSLDLIERQGAPWATHLLGLLSSMGTAGTPLAALASGILAQSPIFPDDFSDDQLLQHLTALANFGLIDLVGTHASTIVKLHPLVQETINDSPAARVRLRDYQRTLASLVAHMQAQGERAPNRRAVAWMANCQQLLESEKPGGWLDDASRHWAITSVSRRRLAGWALPAFAALAAVFGFYQPIRRAQGGAPQSSSTDEAAQATGKVVARSSDIQIGSGMIVGDIVITQPSAGTFKAFSKVCTHQGCDVDSVKQGAILCRCHNSSFSIGDGSPISGPAQKALPKVALRQDGDDLLTD